VCGVLRTGHGGGKGKRVGVSVRIPDRAIAQSLRIRRPGGPLDARVAPLALTVCVAACLVTALASGDASQGAPALAVAAMVPAAVIDIRERRLPDRLVTFAAGVFATGTWIAWLSGQPFDVSTIFFGALVMAGPILALHLLSPGSMGFGDVKAAVVLGAALGSVDWHLAVVGLTVASGLGAAIGIGRRSRTIPFGPFLVIGSAIALVAGSFVSMRGAP